MGYFLDVNSTSHSSHVGPAFRPDVRAEARTHMENTCGQSSCWDAAMLPEALIGTNVKASAPEQAIEGGY
jgi:hypothetical protein